MANRFQTTYKRDFGNVRGFSDRKGKLSSSTNNLYKNNEFGNYESKTKKNVLFSLPKTDCSSKSYFGNSLGVQPMKKSSSYQNLNSQSNEFTNQMRLFGSNDDFDSGFSSDENIKEGKFD